MTKQLIDDTIVYLRKELTRINFDLTWADGAQAVALQTRQKRLMAELDRLQALPILSSVGSGAAVMSSAAS